MNAFTMRTVRDAGGIVRHVPTAFVPMPVKRGRKARPVPDQIKTNGESGAERLRLLIERAERLEEEKQGILDDIKDVFAEAKGTGYDPKSMRAIMAIRKKRKEEFQEEQGILETYMQALGML